jgi:hypothetical protein
MRGGRALEGWSEEGRASFPVARMCGCERRSGGGDVD